MAEHGTHNTPSLAARRAARVLLALCTLLALAQLAACGGGGDDEPDKTIDPLACLHRPELCK